MSSNPKINIHSAPGKEKKFTDGNDLLKLYFQARDNGRQYRFHQTDGTKIKTEPHHLTSGTDFTFELDGMCWKVTDFRVWEQPVGVFNASGTWFAHPHKAEEDPETGTFQAQSGGSGNPEREARAAASA